MSNILQRGTFARSSRLAAADTEPAADTEGKEDREEAARVLSGLSALVRTSPFPAQRAEAIEHIERLLHTPHFGTMARETLCSLLAHTHVTDKQGRHSAIQIALVLYPRNAIAVNAQQQAQELLTKLTSIAQQPHFNFDEFIEAAQTLYGDKEHATEAQQLVLDIVLALIASSSLSFEQTMYALWSLYDSKINKPKVRRVANKVLTAAAQQPERSAFETIEIAEMLYRINIRTSKLKKEATQMLLELAGRYDRHDIPFSAAVAAAFTLYRMSAEGFPEREQAARMLITQARWPAVSVTEALEALTLLYSASHWEGPERQWIIDVLLELAQRKKILVQEVLALDEALATLDPGRPDERQQARERLLLEALQLPALTITEMLDLTRRLLRLSQARSALMEQATHILIELAQRSDLAENEIISLAAMLHYSYLHTPEELHSRVQDTLLTLTRHPRLSVEQLVAVIRGPALTHETQAAQQPLTRALLDLAKRPDLSVEQVVLIAKTLHEGRTAKSPERRYAIQLLLTQAQRPGPSIEQQVIVAEALYQSSHARVVRQKAIQLILDVAHRSGLTSEQALQINTAFFWKALQAERLTAVNMLLDQALRPDLTTGEAEKIALALYQHSKTKQEDQDWRGQDIPNDRRLHIATAILEARGASYEGRAQAVEIVQTLIWGETARLYLKKCWRPLRKPAEAADIPALNELAEDDMLPVEVRDEMYRILRAQTTI